MENNETPKKGMTDLVTEAESYSRACTFAREIFQVSPPAHMLAVLVAWDAARSADPELYEETLTFLTRAKKHKKTEDHDATIPRGQ